MTKRTNINLSENDLYNISEIKDYLNFITGTSNNTTDVIRYALHHTACCTKDDENLPKTVA